MKTVLVPTDFSKNAENALRYAIEIVKKENATIILFHAYQINYSNSYVPYDEIEREKAEAKKESEARLKELCVKVKQLKDVKYETMALDEFPVDAIIETIIKRKIDLVVMGTKGVTNFSEVIFGSNTSKVLEKAKCPVIAVPEGAEFNELKKITYATAFNDCDMFALKNLVEIASPFNAQLNVLHVSNEAISSEMEVEMMQKFMNKVNAEIKYSNLSFQILSGKYVEEVLEEYVKSNSTDLIVLSAHHPQFI